MAPYEHFENTNARTVKMTAAEFEERIEKLIADAREVGLSDEAMIGVLRDVAEALEERLSWPNRFCLENTPHGRWHCCSSVVEQSLR